MDPYTIFAGNLVQGVLWQESQLLLDPVHKALFPDGPDAEGRYHQDDHQYRCHIIQ